MEARDRVHELIGATPRGGGFRSEPGQAAGRGAEPGLVSLTAGRIFAPPARPRGPGHAWLAPGAQREPRGGIPNVLTVPRDPAHQLESVQTGTDVPGAWFVLLAVNAVRAQPAAPRGSDEASCGSR